MFQHLMKENLTSHIVMDMRLNRTCLAYSSTSSTPVWYFWLKWTHLLLDSMQMLDAGINSNPRAKIT